jgi:hypothetical protein
VDNWKGVFFWFKYTKLQFDVMNLGEYSEEKWTVPGLKSKKFRKEI